MNNLQPLLNPASIAILGASADLNKINGRTLRFLLEKGYRGRIFPINPKYQAIAGLRCYPDAAALPEAPDLEGHREPSGTYLVDALRANVSKLNVTRFPYDIARLAQDIAGGIIVTMPSERPQAPQDRQVCCQVLERR